MLYVHYSISLPEKSAVTMPINSALVCMHMTRVTACQLHSRQGTHLKTQFMPYIEAFPKA